MLWILIVSLVIIAWFQALSAVSFWKIKLMYSADIQKQMVYFSQKLFEEIKRGGSLDYEEYFNRKIVGTVFWSGHYDRLSGFGNYGNNGVPGTSQYGGGFYYCVSGNGIVNKITGTGCVENMNNMSTNFSWNPQRYGQYSFQFIDYNSNYDADGGDQNGDGKIIWDDDDEFLWKGPDVFGAWTDVKELYLLSGDKTKRTLFRWTVKKDSQAPSTAWCSISGTNMITGSGCLGTIEFLKLEGRDYGMDHDVWILDADGSDPGFHPFHAEHPAITAFSGSVTNIILDTHVFRVHIFDKIVQIPNRSSDM